jgi:hypothetical protein
MTARLYRATLLATGITLSTIGTLETAKAELIPLPAPGSTADGIPLSLQFDQGIVYSAKLLDALQSAGQLSAPFDAFDYQFTVGTGTIPVLVYTGAGGASNDSPFQDPLQACGGGNCTQFDGTWGINTGDASDFVGTVGALKTVIGSNVPVIYFDHNEQEGQNAVPNLKAAGSLAIYSATNVLKAQFFFDSIGNAARDVDETTGDDLNLLDGIDPYVTSCSDLAIGEGAANNPPCSLFFDTLTNNTYNVSHNSGSGKPDYFLLAAGLDLNNFDDSDKVVIEMHLRNLDPGFDELGIAGLEVEITEVPAPSAVASIALGLMALGGMALRGRRRRA